MYLSRVRLRAEIGSTQLPHLLADRKGYGLHRLFWGLFNNGENNDQCRDFLYREELAVEQLPRPGKRKADPVYYVLSQNEPMENALFEVDAKPYRPKLASGDRLSFKLRVNAVVTRNGKRHDVLMDAQHNWLNTQLQALGQSIKGAKSKRKRLLLDYATDKELAQWRSDIEAGIYRQKLEQKLGRSELMEWAIKTAEAERVCEWWLQQGNRRGFEVERNSATNALLIEQNAYLHHAIPEKGKSAGFSSIDLSGVVKVADIELFSHLLNHGVGPAKAFGCGLMLVRRI